MPSKEFHYLIDKCKEIHDKKSHDYAMDDNPFSNFERAAIIVSWFNNPIDQVFAGIIGIKLSRNAELLNGKSPKNESLIDTMVDGTNYFGLWGAYYLRDQARRNASHYGPEYYATSYEDLKDLEKLGNHLPSNPQSNEGSLGGYSIGGGTVVGKSSESITRTMSELPEICSRCSQIRDAKAEVQIEHAVRFHSAIYTASQKSIKYPNKELILLSPDFFSR